MNLYWFHSLKSSCPLLYKILRKAGDPFLQYKLRSEKKKRNNIFKQNSIQVFSDFCDAFNDVNEEFWLTFGTLLGAVREHGFIAHDLDIDVGVMDTVDFKKLDKSLRRHGFMLTRKIEIYSKQDPASGFEITYGKESVTIDIFVFHRLDAINIQTHDFLQGVDSPDFQIYKTVRKIILPMKELIDYKFLDRNVLIPKNYKDYLSAHYGESYMIPDPTWTTLSSPAAKIQEGSIGVFFK